VGQVASQPKKTLKSAGAALALSKKMGRTRGAAQEVEDCDRQETCDHAPLY
jgi:hypothetical protein